MWWTDEIKASVKRKGAVWKMLTTGDEEGKERCMETYREDKRKVKRCIQVYQTKKKLNKHFGRKMNEDVNENRKSLWKRTGRRRERLKDA